MKEIKVSEGPTIRQMLNMASNLREKLNQASCLTIECWQHTREPSAEYTYQLYIEGFSFSKNYKTWPELFTAYTELMEKEDA